MCYPGDKSLPSSPATEGGQTDYMCPGMHEPYGRDHSFS
ncbi:hypothetical protein A176_005619 [Myxococcus hansupus]|uniref:Uncharacterized protein n=1 Tax=Pseudomyxococcus hansupus TaxID=1297742 RepID=A0A0H4XKE1_9BACT|nr:hypothetical protein A176_005619 [Myxococcus hansupus]